jgi:hypothetical protein
MFYLSLPHLLLKPRLLLLTSVVSEVQRVLQKSNEAQKIIRTHSHRCLTQIHNNKMDFRAAKWKILKNSDYCLAQKNSEHTTSGENSS